MVSRPDSLRQKSQLKVIGLGLPRTGTTSLQQALEQLGYSPCHHMHKDIVMEHPPYTSGRMWRRVFAEKDKIKRQNLLREIYEHGGFQAAVDFPTCAFAEDLLEMYPGAKFILSVRESPESWRTSWNNTLDVTKSPLTAAWDDRNAVMYNGARVYQNNSTEIYTRHNEQVKQIIPVQQLLVHQPRNGWEPLCQFLGAKIPDSPYPCVNDSKANMKGRYIGAAVGALTWILLGVMTARSWRLLFA